MTARHARCSPCEMCGSPGHWDPPSVEYRCVLHFACIETLPIIRGRLCCIYLYGHRGNHRSETLEGSTIEW